MADVSVQNERINGWIPSSATNVILNWPERIKTQPHDDRDNCFLPFDSKGPCGMTVNNDIDDDSATKHSDSHRGGQTRGRVALRDPLQGLFRRPPCTQTPLHLTDFAFRLLFAMWVVSSRMRPLVGGHQRHLLQRNLGPGPALHSPTHANRPHIILHYRPSSRARHPVWPASLSGGQTLTQSSQKIFET